MCGGCRSIAARSFCSVSPVRTAVRISVEKYPRSSASCWISRSGSSRFFCTSFDKAFNGDTYTTCVHGIRHPSMACRSNESIATRKAASVFPDPVGAEIRVAHPATIFGHPASCGSVGEPNRRRNHSAVTGCAHASDAGTSSDADRQAMGHSSAQLRVPFASIVPRPQRSSSSRCF